MSRVVRHPVSYISKQCQLGRPNKIKKFKTISSFCKISNNFAAILVFNVRDFCHAYTWLVSQRFIDLSIYGGFKPCYIVLSTKKLSQL